MWFLTVFALLHISLTGADVLSKREYAPADEGKMKIFTQQFRITLMHLIENEWEETEPLVEQLNVEKSECESRIANMQPRCESCAKDECTPELYEVILKEAEKILKKFAKEYIMEALGWGKVSKFFGGVGKKFADWSGWNKMGDFFEDLGKGLVHWDGWEDIGDSFEDLGKGILDIGEDIGEGIIDFGEDVVDKVKDIGEDLEDGVKDLGKGIEDTVKDLGKNLEDGVKDLGKGLEDTVKDIGKGLEDGLKDIGDSVAKIFKPRISLPRISLPRIRFGRGWGKKKRAILYEDDLYDDDEDLSVRRLMDPETRKCMEKCSSCDPFLVDDQTRTRLVCGDDFVRQSERIQTVASKIKLLFDRTMDDNNKIVSAVDFEIDSWSLYNLLFDDVQITVFFEGGYRTYKSKFPFRVDKIPISAALMAKEYFDQFMQKQA